ncbi:ATP-binding protein [Brachyspira hyodysenteriae]|nr:ATP-binding protein [Brachyspira hyodysenteriae]
MTSENTSFEMNIYNNLKNIVEDNSKRKYLKIYIKVLIKKIKDIRFSGNKIVIEIAGLRHTINIKSMGRGFQTYINILSSVISGNKYIFIDEIENGMHFESIKTLLENILSLSKEYGLQFFITTHNKELLEILNDCLIEKDYKDMLSVYNVYYNRENNISVANYNQESFSHFMKNENEIRY